MLFSHQGLADDLEALFECAWEELRPAPRVHVDFGNGYELDRTLMGNVATFFCTPEGEVYDVLPGIMDVPTYRELAFEARAAFDALPSHAAARKALVARRALERTLRARVVADAESRTTISASKDAVELPVRANLPSMPAMLTKDETAASPSQTAVRAPSKSLVESPLLVAAGAEAPTLDVEPAPVDVEVAVSKWRVEEPVKQSVNRSAARPAELTPGDVASLARDTNTVRTVLLPGALEILRRQPLATPEALTTPLFRDVLHVDLDDPYLGLAPDVLGGRLGRRSRATR